MNILIVAAACCAAFLWAGIPTGYLAVRILKKEDIRKTGSGNIGATNVKRTLGWGGFVSVLLLDAVKGALPLVLWLSFTGAGGPRSGTAEALIAAATIAGNVFSPWLGFRGGKGIATSLGCLAALCPGPLLAMVAVFALVLALSNYVSLASITAAGLFPAIVFVFQSLTHATDRVPLIAFSFLLAILLIVRHRENIVRLSRGEEHKFFSKKRQNT
jgi:glycerol-3-phosphate acyltransferase PlsY